VRMPARHYRRAVQHVEFFALDSYSQFLADLAPFGDEDAAQRIDLPAWIGARWKLAFGPPVVPGHLPGHRAGVERRRGPSPRGSAAATPPASRPPRSASSTSSSTTRSRASSSMSTARRSSPAASRNRRTRSASRAARVSTGALGRSRNYSVAIDSRV
jgi:hypothetical protein